MARKAREKSSTGIYHILLRANNKLFLNDGDREYFVSLMKQHFGDGISIYGYRIDFERVHMVLKEHTKTISEAMKVFCTSYARYFNRAHGTDGKLFDGRFKSEPIESDKTLSEVLGYLYRDRADLFEKDDVVNRREIEKIKLGKNCIAMDDYSSMTDEEIAGVIDFLCGDKLSGLSDEEKLAVALEADTASRLRSGMIKNALGINRAVKKSVPKRTDEKKAKAEKKTDKKPGEKHTANSQKRVPKKTEPEKTVQKPKKKELPVWLL